MPKKLLKNTHKKKRIIEVIDSTVINFVQIAEDDCGPPLSAQVGLLCKLRTSCERVD